MLTGNIDHLLILTKASLNHSVSKERLDYMKGQETELNIVQILVTWIMYILEVFNNLPHITQKQHISVNSFVRIDQMKILNTFNPMNTMT